jgi:hypothetical protein
VTPVEDALDLHLQRRDPLSRADDDWDRQRERDQHTPRPPQTQRP